MPCMLSCSGVQVSCLGVRGAEGQGKRKGIVVRQCLKEAWNERAGRGTRTGYKGWYARGERARNRKALHDQRPGLRPIVLSALRAALTPGVIRTFHGEVKRADEYQTSHGKSE